MAEYGVDIALRVTGEERLNKALRAIGQLENRMKSINAIDITAPGAGKLGDKIREALVPFRDLARESVNTGKALKNTQARMQAVAESFRFLSSNAKIGSADFKNFTIAADNQARALEKVAIQQENIIRSARGMQSIEERQIQLARRRTLLLTLQRQRDAGFGMQGPELPPAVAPRQAGPLSGVRGRLGGAVSGGIIGGVFPLLFGQSTGAAAGGGIGGFLGGLAGPGGSFAGSLLGTILGDIASRGQAVKQLAEDIGFSAQQTKQLSDAFKIANTDVEKFTAIIQNVRGVGLALDDQAKAIQLITTLTDKYGSSFEKVGNAITSALESGKVSQATLNQLSSQSIDIQGALATKYKTNRDAILKMAKDGTISVQTLIDTLVDMGNKGTDAANKPKSAMQSLQDSVEKLGTAVANLASKFVTAFGPVFKWLTDRVTEFINAVSRAIARLADLMAGGRMTQATIQAETAAQQATTRRFGALGGIRAINPAAEAFFQQEKNRQLKNIVPGAFAPVNPAAPLEGFRAPSQAAESGAASKDRTAERAAKAAAKEAERVTAVVRGRMAEAEVMKLQSTIQDRISAAEASKDPMLIARLQGQQKIVDLQYQYAKELANENNIRAQQAIIYEGQTALIAAQRDTERELAEIARLDGQRRLDDMQKYIEQQYELNTAVKQQKDLAESISGSLNQGLVSTFDLLIQGSQSWQQSLQQIASGVLIDIANQLLRIFVIEQAINSIRTLLTPFNPATPLGAGGGIVGRFGTFGPNYGIPQRAAGGPVSAGSPYIVGERGPELFMPRTSGSIYPNDAMGMGGANIVVNVDASGSSVQGNQPDAAALGRVVGAAVQAELIKQKRPGGLLA